MGTASGHPMVLYKPKEGRFCGHWTQEECSPHSGELPEDGPKDILMRTNRKKRGIVPNGHNMPASPLAGKRFFQRTTRRASSSFLWQTTSNVVILWCRTGRKKRDIVPSGHNMPASLLAGKRFFQCNDDVTRRHYTRFPTPSSAPRGPRFSPQAPRSAPSAGYTPVPSPDPPPARAGPRSPPRAR